MKISTEQLSLLNSFSENSLINELFEHCKQTFPFLSQEIGEEKIKGRSC